jgi:hypothetical protein
MIKFSEALLAKEQPEGAGVPSPLFCASGHFIY